MQSWRGKSLWLALSASWLLVLLRVFPLLRLAVPARPWASAPQGWPRWLDTELLPSFSQPGELPEDAPQPPQAPRGGGCDWGACFDASKCRTGGLKVFVHPVAGPISAAHRKILASIESSRYHTASPEEACLLLFLSLEVPAGECSPVPQQWNGGRNHLVLDLHPAPCPQTFQLGRAMVAKASPTVDTFRPGFDVALPLLPEAHPLRGGAPGRLRQHSPHPGVPLLALAEERGGWRTAGTDPSACPWDGRCEQDRGPEQSHPGGTLPNATFCLIPGHRPDALHFLQALQAGCIPVLLSPRWELPFSEVIDWTKAAIVADERLPFQVLAALQEMPLTRVLALRQQTQFLWDAYFSSVEKVTHTTLEIIQDRIFGASAHASLLWNSPPGALLALPTFSTSPSDFPFYHLQRGSRPVGRFSALIWVGAPGQPPLKLIQAVAGSQNCAQILVLWSSEKPPPSRWPETAVPLTVMDGQRKVSDRFLPHRAISTDAILSLDGHSSVTTSEVDFAFLVWQSFPERMVGFLTWNHFWDEAQGGWGYTAERANEFSMVLTSAAFYHRYYHTLFTHSLPKALRTLADEAPTCVDILMNFLVAAVTKLPPIKVPYGKQHLEATPPLVPGGPEPQPTARDCINQMAAGFGYMPLVSSRLRLDPVLFKDPVSVLRKKYRRLEKP
ncbi:exostosin-like 1 isoform X1 [Prionailurus bengalensis]|uniref:exostosin-like 1 isoform X1 n=1 Tax=Prionailurus bengalensis TaxID=37029 RepID=UPI001CAA310F|nr:exostosin-like 1 isoform X1 [Prionailurus bengalensis]XP_043430050.1 exostosin-like 1 isoform X1 [Prionailurus bengalensis]